ncbi:nicotinic acetylcholine receptor beta2 [Neodiprion pinetum]|uniref:Acetylcholine receptor subunit beta-like 2 n=1 Tax=Neodiprion lecontei TaxID=441921 RepID=A0A6J0BB03_NEOLC|nr:acetylcholine receptor subunit beta-like 2 [Neodiprion lecontei]XP_046432320.1 acetylcholine receptor subunit beta-like 2 [Neodiprion fabricii]XP_046489056.1 acetylcholine receptor subunit beta-like 2 [Neodiprion pinetum]XP_046626057.1 acetylcholine receptor subunit beta-like 2 isoform X1 [Neodiprion virginianus]
MKERLLLALLFSLSVTSGKSVVKTFEANPDTKRLYDDLLSNYNRLIRPVINNTETLTVWLGLKLSQLIEMNLKNQVMTTNVWVEQKWFDYKLRWDPDEYGGVEMLYVPSENIWLPDIVLYNNADGNYEVTLMTKATLKYTGEVFWKPPAIYKSSCEINVEYFPFDEQSCIMKFGSWTYNGVQVDLKHMEQISGSNLVHVGIDLSEFYLSVEWDILEVPAARNEEYYPCCTEPYSDITFNITMRRKTLFYTVNLIIPCVGITFLTVLVFYLPSDSGEKVALCASILLSLTVFFLLLAEIIPPTSLAVPLLGKYLLFTMILVTLSIWVTVCVLNVHFRSPSTHNMSPWVQRVFLNWMPRVLMMRRTPYSTPEYDDTYIDNGYTNEIDCSFRDSISDYPSELKGSPEGFESVAAAYKNALDEEGRHVPHASVTDSENTMPRHLSPDVISALQGVRFIAQHIKDADKDNEVIEDWKFVAMVLDRFFLWVFTLACIGGTMGIIFQAPSLYDTRKPVDQLLSGIPLRKGNFVLPPEVFLPDE